MKKLLVMLSVVLVSVFALAELKDVPTNHWAYDSVVMLEKAGVITGYPDGTFKGTNNVTRYELAVFLARIMKLLEEDIQKLSVTVDVHENDISALYDIVGQLKKDLTAKIGDIEKMKNDLGEVSVKLLNLETNFNDAIPMLRNLVYQNSENIKELEAKMIKYINVKVNSISKKLDDVKSMSEFNTDTLNGLAAKIGEVEYALRKQIEEFGKVLDENSAKVDSLSEEVESLSKRVDILDKDVIKIYENLSKKVSKEEVEEMLNSSIEAVNGQIEFLYKKISVTEENLMKAVDEKASKADVENLANELNSTNAKVDEISKKVDSVNTMSILGLVAGLVGLGLAIYAAFIKP